MSSSFSPTVSDCTLIWNAAHSRTTCCWKKTSVIWIDWHEKNEILQFRIFKKKIPWKFKWGLFELEACDLVSSLSSLSEFWTFCAARFWFSWPKSARKHNLTVASYFAKAQVSVAAASSAAPAKPEVSWAGKSCKAAARRHLGALEDDRARQQKVEETKRPVSLAGKVGRKVKMQQLQKMKDTSLRSESFLFGRASEDGQKERIGSKNCRSSSLIKMVKFRENINICFVTSASSALIKAYSARSAFCKYQLSSLSFYSSLLRLLIFGWVQLSCGTIQLSFKKGQLSSDKRLLSSLSFYSSLLSLYKTRSARSVYSNHNLILTLVYSRDDLSLPYDRTSPASCQNLLHIANSWELSPPSFRPPFRF